MLSTYLPAEARFYYRFSWALLLLPLPLLTGLLASFVMNFDFAGLQVNSPWVITYQTSIVSLANIFLVTFFTVQVFFREKENGFEAVVYAHPLHKPSFLFSRWLLVVGLTALLYLLFTVGCMAGHWMRSHDTLRFGSFRPLNYIVPYLTLVLPNILFCSAWVALTAWITQRPLLVYMAGLSCYILYIVMGLLTDSPLFAHASPVSAASMAIAAKLDPFGIAGFFEQTQSWSVPQRNTQLILPRGNFLLNRIAFTAAAVLLVIIGSRFYQFRLSQAPKPRRRLSDAATASLAPAFQPVLERYTPLLYWWKTAMAQWKLGNQLVFKSRALLVLLLLFVFFLGIEIYSHIDAGIRIPQRYASTTQMVNRIYQSLPAFAMIALLFYSQLLLWKRKEVNMETLEKASPLPFGSRLFAQWMVLNSLLVCLISCALLTGLVFQFFFQYNQVNWKLYSSLFFTIGWPCMLCAGILLLLQVMVGKKYPGILLAAVFLLVTQTKLGRQIGLEHPFARFANAYLPAYSDMNGYGAYLYGFGITQLFWTCFTLLLCWWIIRWKTPLKNRRPIAFLMPAIAVAGMVFSGWPIYQQTSYLTKKQQIAWQAGYEKKYRAYQQVAQASITRVNTNIDLYPASNSYTIQGSYQLLNQESAALDSLLLYIDPTMEIKSLQLENAALLEKDDTYGHWRFRFRQPLTPGDSICLTFRLHYTWSPFNQHQSFNSILDNGSFMRISRYFPQLGYQSENELESVAKRNDAGLGNATETARLQDSARYNFPAGIILDAVVSTEADQQVAGTGQLINSWSKQRRNWFHFNSIGRIPFRFGFSSGRYAITKEHYKGIELSVMYHPEHAENAATLLEESKRTLDYCTRHFSAYPYTSICFAEISSFTSGFNATAYPGTIFMNETGSFHADLRTDAKRDVINELAAHELAHEWWGTFQLHPADKEGAQMLTETLAMYTEIMLLKEKLGEETMKEAVDMLQVFYDRERWTINQEALYKVESQNAPLAYYKGAVVMYKLYKLIGEEKINTALHKFLAANRYPYAAPTSEDLIKAILAEAPASQAAAINRLFRE
ncbi:M1 family aminopeptidase [Flavihumibacter sp. CACIAM 22H1]|uniref:ABC transporter permease/M1 family aminopeptidase n=1 Tax=Flavihumibacter sp. CACIAM 22H1 TaxID=1812911 RepID=UPI0007A8CDEA|nr:M1 family aminopeptidase [Flavihumibacter sp. CACIAM 22H1]KYP14105.1 MAG: hypothetical protein A1D16_00095 [Flavihumibacter sp. CACIAM 22H1]